MSGESSIRNYRLTDHAKLEMTRRQISETEIAQALSAPDQIEVVARERRIYQARVIWGQPAKAYLLRVIVDIGRIPPEVVSAYRTSKISK